MGSWENHFSLPFGAGHLGWCAEVGSRAGCGHELTANRLNSLTLSSSTKNMKINNNLKNEVNLILRLAKLKKKSHQLNFSSKTKGQKSLESADWSSEGSSGGTVFTDPGCPPLRWEVASCVYQVEGRGLDVWVDPSCQQLEIKLQWTNTSFV